MEAIVEPKKRIDLQNVTVRFSVRFEFVLFPFDIIELLDNLIKIGYTPMVPPLPRVSGQNVRLSAKGKIAQKGEAEIELNDERGVLAVTCYSPNNAVKSLNEIIQLIKEKLDVDLTTKATFYEFMGNFEAKTDKNPLEIIQRVNEKNSCIEDLGKILGQKVSSFSLRLVPKGQVPSSAEWLEITIEPNIIKPNTTYRVLAICRSNDKAKMDVFVSSWMGIMVKIIETIES